MQTNDSFSLDPLLKDATYEYIRYVYGVNYHTRAKVTIDNTDAKITKLLNDLAIAGSRYVNKLDSSAKGAWVDAAKSAISHCLDELKHV